MADEESGTDEPVEIFDETEKTKTRSVVEIRPKNPSPEIYNDEPPKFSLGGIFNVIRKKGLIEALSDDAWGPHVHIFMILIVILLIAVGVAIIQFSTM